jgi:hypothetical protein
LSVTRIFAGLLLLLLVAACTGPVAPALPVQEDSSTPIAPTPTPLPAVAPAEPTIAASPPVPTPEAPPTPTALPIAMDAPATLGSIQNFELVGHTHLGSVGWHAGLALKDHCAYVGNRNNSRIAIVDVNDPAQPVRAGEIVMGPGTQPVEVRTLPDRNLLVVADLAAAPHILTFDITDCMQPIPLGAITLPQPPHEFYLWTDGQRILAYVATFAHPDLIVVDLTEPADPRELFRWSAPEVGVPGVMHSVTVSDDGSRAYLSMWDGGLLVADLIDGGIFLHREAGAGEPVLWFHNTHSAVPLRDPRFLMITSEIYTCPFGTVAIVDVTNAAHPQIVSQLRLPENRCDQLPHAEAVFSAHNPLVVGDLVFLSWYGGGLQVVDVRNPYDPQRVAQFVPTGEGAAARSYIGGYPVQTWSFPILRDGLIYVADIQSGLYVLRYTGPGAEVVNSVPLAEGNVTLLP